MDYDQIVKMSFESIRSGKEHGINKYLVDERSLTSDLSVTEISNLPEAFKEQGLEPTNKVAVVFSSRSTKLEDISLFETATFNYGFLIKLFIDKNQALEWLNQQ